MPDRDSFQIMGTEVEDMLYDSSDVSEEDASDIETTVKPEKDD